MRTLAASGALCLISLLALGVSCRGEGAGDSGGPAGSGPRPPETSPPGAAAARAPRAESPADPVLRAPAQGSAADPGPPAPPACPSAKTPVPSFRPVPAPEWEALEAKLVAHVQTWAFADPKNVWAIAHGLVALGLEETPRPDAQLARIFSAAQPLGPGPGAALAFPPAGPDGQPIEPHPHLILRALASAALPIDRAFPGPEGPRTLARVYEGAVSRFSPPGPEGWGDAAWILIALADLEAQGALASPPRLAGRPPHAWAGEALSGLERATAFMDLARRSRQPLQKRRQGIYAEPCGGFHFIQGVARWGGALDPTRLAAVTELLSYRLVQERALYTQTLLGAPPAYHRLLKVQQLKFFGHWLEAAADLRDAGAPPNPIYVSLAQRSLRDAASSLMTDGAFDHMEQVRAERLQTYLDLIGDSAHALRGMRRWAGGPGCVEGATKD